MLSINEINSAIELSDGRIVINNVVSFYSLLEDKLGLLYGEENRHLFVPIQVIVVSEKMSKAISLKVPRVTV